MLLRCGGGFKRPSVAAADGQVVQLGDSSSSVQTAQYWQVPAGVTSICAVALGAGYGFDPAGAPIGGGGGALSYSNAIPVTPGETLILYAGTGKRGRDLSLGDSGVTRQGDLTQLLLAKGGQGQLGGASADGIGDVKYSGGRGGNIAAQYGVPGPVLNIGGGGGGAAGYIENGATGGDGGSNGNGSAGSSSSGSGAAGGGGGSDSDGYRAGAGGGGHYAFITGGSGATGGAGAVRDMTPARGGYGGCGRTSGTGWDGWDADDGGRGGMYGGGAGGGLSSTEPAGAGFVYVIWGAGRTIPFNSAPV